MDKEEARTIYEMHYVALYKLACYLTKSTVLAEDLVSETFMCAFDRYHQYDASRPLKPWLTQILVNTTRKYWRQNKWRSLFQINELELQEEKDAIERVFENDRDFALWQAVTALSVKSREVVVLHYYEGLPLQEVASLLGIPLGTCKSRLNTGLNGLRKEAHQLCTYL